MTKRLSAKMLGSSLAACLSLVPQLVACGKSDVGKPCPELNVTTQAAEGDATRIETAETVEYNTAFPCDDFVCVASEGRTGYCSKKCRVDAGCPDGFACRVVQDIGPFAGEAFCVWKHCQRRRDCGSSKEDFCCLPAASADPNEELKLCAFSDDGKCP